MAGRLFPAGGGRSIPLTKPVMVVGRAYGCDIRLNDPVVSNRHCLLTFDGRCWTVEDEGSRNGTMLNGRRVMEKEPMKSGDTLTISTKFRFVIEYTMLVERQRFAEAEETGAPPTLGDDRSYLEHGPATNRLEPHDKDVWSEFER
ncbi:MAG TPA: FHA domain-containing protein [Gemmataceae bacterium]|nr:FHA domain-containing protein [Gemmataceae bacterium]